MVSMADEEGRLVLMGVDATYCVVDVVDTTATALNDHFLHQAIEDASTAVKQEPMLPDDSDQDSDQDSIYTDDSQHSWNSNPMTPDLYLKGYIGSGDGQTAVGLMTMTDIKMECSAEVSTGIKGEYSSMQTGSDTAEKILSISTSSCPGHSISSAPSASSTSCPGHSISSAPSVSSTSCPGHSISSAPSVSGTSVLRAALQRFPVFLRDSQIRTALTPFQSMPQPKPSPSTENMEIVDNPAGKTIAAPVLQRTNKRKAAQKPLADASAENETDHPQADAEGAGEEGEKVEEEGEGARVKRSREKPYQCGECGRWFGCKSHVVEHMRTHTGEKPFQCPICHKRFSQKSNIHQHMNTHTQQRPFRCSDCGKDFMYRGSLYKHKRLHTGERPYTCGMCQRRFTHASQLFEHMRTHTNERPFKCGVCGRAFAHSGTMHRHQRNHFSMGRGGKGKGKEGVVVSPDINHNSPAYPSHMTGEASSAMEASGKEPESGLPLDESPIAVDQSLAATESVQSGTTSSQSPGIAVHANQPPFVPANHITDMDSQGTKEGTPLSVSEKRSSGQQINTLGDVLMQTPEPGSGSQKPSAAKSSASRTRSAVLDPSGSKSTPRRRKMGRSAEEKSDVHSTPADCSVQQCHPVSLIESQEVTDTAYHPARECAESVVVQTSANTRATFSVEQRQMDQLLLASSSPSSSSPADVALSAESDAPSTSATKSLGKAAKQHNTAGPEVKDTGQQKKKRTRRETPDLKIYSCDICSHSFCHRRSVKRHRLASHPEVAIKTGEGNVGKAMDQVEGHGSQQPVMESNPVSTTLLKSLLTLTAEQALKPSTPTTPVSTLTTQPIGVQAAVIVDPMETQPKVTTQPIEPQLTNKVEPMEAQPPVLVQPVEASLQIRGQPMENQQTLGKASASLQAIAHLCVQGNIAAASAIPDINHNIKSISGCATLPDTKTSSPEGSAIVPDGKPSSPKCSAIASHEKNITTRASAIVSDGRDTRGSAIVSDGRSTRVSAIVSDGRDTRGSAIVSDGRTTSKVFSTVPDVSVKHSHRKGKVTVDVTQNVTHTAVTPTPSPKTRGMPRIALKLRSSTLTSDISLDMKRDLPCVDTSSDAAGQEGDAESCQDGSGGLSGVADGPSYLQGESSLEDDDCHSIVVKLEPVD